MQSEKLQKQGRLYLIRHGDYENEGIKRLSERGVAQIKTLAERIEQELHEAKAYNHFFSSSFPRAIDSALTSMGVLGGEWNTLKTVSALYGAFTHDGGQPKENQEFLDMLELWSPETERSPTNIAIGHGPFLSNFPYWLYKTRFNMPEGEALKLFNNQFGQNVGTGIYIDFATGQYRELDLNKPDAPLMNPFEAPVLVTLPKAPPTQTPQPKREVVVQPVVANPILSPKRKSKSIRKPRTPPAKLSIYDLFPNGEEAQPDDGDSLPF